MSTKGNTDIASLYWQQERFEGTFASYFMHYFIIVMTFINQVYLQIIMFSFLIAMVKRTFDEQTKFRAEMKLSQRCAMNQASHNLYFKIPFTVPHQTDLIVIQANFPKVHDEDDEIKKLKSQIETIQKEMKTHVEEALKTQADEIRKDIQKSQEAILYCLKNK